MINLMKYHIKVLFAHKTKIFLLTMVSIVIMGTCFGVLGKKKEEYNPPVKIGIINEDTNKYSKTIIHFFKNNTAFNQMISVIEGTKEEIYTKFEKKELDVYLIIPKGFVKNMMYINNPPIEVKINGENTTKTLMLKNVLNSYEKYIKAVEINAVGLSDIMKESGADKEQIETKNMEISISLVLTVLGKEQFFKINEIKSDTSTSLGHYYFLSILFIFFFYCSLRTGLDMIEELKNGTLNRMKTAGVSMVFVILSKVFVFSFLLFFMFLLPYWMIEKSIKLHIIFFLFLVLIFLNGFAILFSAFVKSKEKFIIVYHVYGFFTIVFGGGIIPIMYLPEILSNLSKAMPNYWFIKIVLYLEQGEKAGIFYFLILIFIISIELVIGAYLYERNEVYHEF